MNSPVVVAIIFLALFVLVAKRIPADKGWSGREWHSDKDDDK